MEPHEVSLKILTFNLWGIFNSRHRNERMAQFASKVSHYDVIVLQEQFSKSDFDLIIQKIPRHIRDALYFRRFPSAYYGSGLAVISRYPISNAFFYTYPLQGLPEKILHGDYYANKGVALVKLRVPMTIQGVATTRDVLVYTTHLVAVYEKLSQLQTWKDEQYLSFRLSQAIALAEFIANTSSPKDHVIIGGDFNSSQRSLEVQIMLILLKRRGYLMASVLPSPSSILESAKTEKERLIAYYTYTYSENNTFNASKTSYFKLLNMQSDIPSQIDHIFFSSNSICLQPFEQCPDAARDYPFYINDEGIDRPCGVVVFTDNSEVFLPAKKKSPIYRQIADSIRANASSLGHNFQSYADNFADWIVGESEGSPKGSKKAASAVSNSNCPISDHYGVAAKLELKENPESVASFYGIDESTVPRDSWPLVDDEVIVVANVVQYLDQYVRDLRRQARLLRYLSAFSFFGVVINIYILRYAKQDQTERTKTILTDIFNVASSIASPQDAGNPNETKLPQWLRSLASYMGRVSRINHQTDSSNENSSNSKPKKLQIPALPTPDFQSISENLSYSSFLTVPIVSALTVIAASFTSFASLAVALLHREGNANILEEQIRRVRTIYEEESLQRQTHSKKN